MLHWRPIRDRHVWLETHQRPTCLIWDLLETEMTDQRPYNYIITKWILSIKFKRISIIEYLYLKSNWSTQECCLGWVSDLALWSIRHVDLLIGLWVSDKSDKACWGLPSGMSVSDGSMIKNAVLRWFFYQAWWCLMNSDMPQIIIIFPHIYDGVFLKTGIGWSFHVK